MFNLLKSDLCRIVRMPAFWALTLLVVAALTSSAWFLDYLASPEFAQSVEAFLEENEAASSGGEASAQEASENPDEVEPLNEKTMVSVTHMWANTFLDGGMLGIIGSLLAAIFLLADFKNGFIKTLPMDRWGRWRYFGEKTLFVGLLQAYVLALCAATSYLAFYGFGFTYEHADPLGDVALWLLCAWLYVSALALIVAWITWLLRSEAVSSLAALLISGGIFGALLLQLISYFSNAVGFLAGIPQWLPISARIDLRLGGSALLDPSVYESFAAVPVWTHEVIVCGLFVLVSCVVIFGLCRKRDIA